MKRAKIALTLIILMGITGGALAYKASRVGSYFFTEKVVIIGGQGTTVCTVATMLPYTTTPLGPLTIRASTQSTYGPCTVLEVDFFL
ncbi:hypothetical protein [Chitinophaga eiseniae]|uniref:Uncharacterized protein n=1 Tax=Chitinophaga eiseniae TaxID=634771 RepID=A0A847SE08_9BACT|nr:hypothetical protein [Chitinophaga eiseniae]NLR81420.1 hypothetical protein [Chitinophaga eiseniae]